MQQRLKIHFAELVPDKTTPYSKIGQYFSSCESHLVEVVDNPDLADVIVIHGCHLWPNDVLRLMNCNVVATEYAEKVLVLNTSDRPSISARGLYASLDIHSARIPGIVCSPYFELPTMLKGPMNAQDVKNHVVFFGSRTHWSRSFILGQHAEGIALFDSSMVESEYGVPVSEDVINNYSNAMASSTFSLCPRGHGYNSFRFYESFLHGSVPVLISDFAALPPFVNWEQCIVRLQFSDLPFLSAEYLLLNSLPTSELKSYGKRHVLPKLVGPKSLEYFGRLCKFALESRRGTWMLKKHEVLYSILARKVHSAHSRLLKNSLKVKQ